MLTTEDSFTRQNLLSPSLVPRFYHPIYYSTILIMHVLENTHKHRVKVTKGSSKVIMGATLIMVVSIAIVLGLVLVLLAELYCSLFLRGRRRQSQASSSSNIPNSNSAATTIDGGSPQHDEDLPGIPSLRSFYAQGVLHAPRNFLFPSVYGNQNNEDLEKKQHDSQFTKFCESPPSQKPTSSPLHVYSLPSLAPPRLIHEVPLHCSTSTYNDEVCGGSNKESYIYICNPIYDNEENRASRVDNTPFETPDSSPSRLENTNGSSGEDDDNDNGESTTSSPPPCSSSRLMTPPLTPMKKLPAEACSISLRDARSLATSGSDEGVSSSSTSGSPCTSPSW